MMLKKLQGYWFELFIILFFVTIVAVMIVGFSSGDALSDAKRAKRYVVELISGDAAEGDDLWIYNDGRLCLTEDKIGEVCYPLTQVKRWYHTLKVTNANR